MCQYCGGEPQQLTVDHVIPRSKGGPSSWDNVVTCCAPCNRRKGDRLPKHANMHPKSKPAPPRVDDLRARGGAEGAGGLAAVPRRLAAAPDRQLDGRRHPHRLAHLRAAVVRARAHRDERGGVLRGEVERELERRRVDSLQVRSELVAEALALARSDGQEAELATSSARWRAVGVTTRACRRAGGCARSPRRCAARTRRGRCRRRRRAPAARPRRHSRRRRSAGAPAPRGAARTARSRAPAPARSRRGRAPRWWPGARPEVHDRPRLHPLGDRRGDRLVVARIQERLARAHHRRVVAPRRHERHVALTRDVEAVPARAANGSAVDSAAPRGNAGTARNR